MSVTTRPKRPTQPRMSEAELLDAVVDLAHAKGWLVHHCRAAYTARGFRTPIQGDAGFCDLVLCRPGRWPVGTLVDWTLRDQVGPRILFVELKADKGRVSPEQQAWLDALAPYSAVWRPSMWHSGEIERALR